MERPRPGIGAELVPLVLVLASLGGTTALVIGVQKRYLEDEAAKSRPPVLIAARPVPPPAPPKPESEPEPVPKPKVAPAPKPVDPTPAAVAEIKAAESEQRRETAAMLDRIRGLEQSLDRIKGKADESGKNLSKIEEMAKALGERAEALEFEAARASIEVDVLEKQKQETKVVASNVSNRTSYAILPHRGPNGTWRRPIVIECHDGQVSVRPKGPSFGIGELLDLGFGNSTFRGTVAREAVRVQRGITPDGHSVVPYFYFLIRPDGIKAYYAARRQLEPLGIAFGYELVDQDWEVEFPDLDDPDNWTVDETPKALVDPGAPGTASRPGGSPFGGGAGGTKPSENPFLGGEKAGDNPFVWSTPDAKRPDKPGGSGAGNGLGDGRAEKLIRELEAAAAAGGDPPGGGRPSDPTIRQGLGSGGSGVTGVPPSGLPGGFEVPPGLADLGASGLPKGAELPPGLGESIPPGSGIDKEWAARMLANRGGGISPGLAELAGRVGGVASGGALEGKAGEFPPGGSGTAGQTGSLAGRSGPAGGPGGPQGNPGEGESGGQGMGEKSVGSGGPASPDADKKGIPGESGGGTSGLGFGSSRVEGFEMVVACESRGVVIHPGDYRVTTRGLAGKEPLLAGQLRSLLQARREARPGKTIVPSIRFLVEPGGQGTFSTARSQIALDGIDWPTSMQISGGDVLRGLSREDW